MLLNKEIFLQMVKYLFLAILIIIVVMSVIPYSGIHDATIKDIQFRLDYILHFLAYFTLTCSYFLWKRDKFKLKIFIVILVYFLFSLLLATGTELIQMIIPGRTFNPVDIYANITGTILGFIIIPVLLLGINLGIVGIHIITGFSFVIPMTIRIIGIFSLLYVLFSIYLNIKHNHSIL